MTSRECREQANRFAALSLEGGISVRRATILMAIAENGPGGASRQSKCSCLVVKYDEAVCG
jgi:hypothetical protein